MLAMEPASTTGPADTTTVIIEPHRRAWTCGTNAPEFRSAALPHVHHLNLIVVIGGRRGASPLVDLVRSCGLSVRLEILRRAVLLRLCGWSGSSPLYPVGRSPVAVTVPSLAFPA